MYNAYVGFSHHRLCPLLAGREQRVSTGCAASLVGLILLSNLLALQPAPALAATPPASQAQALPPSLATRPPISDRRLLRPTDYPPQSPARQKLRDQAPSTAVRSTWVGIASLWSKIHCRSTTPTPQANGNRSSPLSSRGGRLDQHAQHAEHQRGPDRQPGQNQPAHGGCRLGTAGAATGGRCGASAEYSG